MDDLAKLKQALKPDCISISDLFSAMRNLAMLQIKSVPDERLSTGANWNALLILEELQDWLKSVDDDP